VGPIPGRYGKVNILDAIGTGLYKEKIKSTKSDTDV
jgi:hypothetical protein